MERLLTVVFGPSRSKRFPKAVAAAGGCDGECGEVEPGRYRVRFRLAADAASYSGLGRLLEWVRHWRATEVYDGDAQVSVFHAREMAWCASFYLGSFGECREQFRFGVLPRCGVCPLFDPERAIRAGIPEEPVAGERGAGPSRGEDAELTLEPDLTIVTDLDLLFNPNLLMLLDGDIPGWMDLSPLVPDFPPDEWGEPAGEQEPG